MRTSISGKTDKTDKPMRDRRPSEASFSLLETVIALGLMVTVILEVTFIQGKAITFGDFNRQLTQATWLAKAVLEKVEWGSRFYPFKEVKADLKDQTFPQDMCPSSEDTPCPYKFNLSVEEFKLPVTELIAGYLGGGKSSDSPGGGGAGGLGSAMEGMVKQFLGDESLKIAHVQVTWAEGSKQAAVDVAYLLTNQRYLDEQIFSQKAPIGMETTVKKIQQTGSARPK
ncbi:MAG: hypothetical protein H6618_00730 [Deltaproteobacteria bacterium]|nr:hypothetical protein [Deltaproteobacteria bacterium]